MMTAYGSFIDVASSAMFEEYFKDLWMYIPSIKQANKFLASDVKYIDSQIILAKSALLI